MADEERHPHARRVLLEHLPEYAESALRLLGEGWDFRSYLVGEELVLRLPKGPFAAYRLRQEAKVLSLVEGRLGVATPHLRLVGDGPPLAGIYPWLRGEPLALDAASGPALGEFLRRLHGVPRGEVRDAGIAWFPWPGGGRGWEGGLRGFRSFAVRRLAGILHDEELARIDRHFARFLGRRENFTFEARLIHGDLAPEHLLDTGAGGLGAVIDFGDAGLGDPAYDVRPEWTDWYGQVSAGFRRRQLFYRSLEPLHASIHAMETGDEPLCTPPAGGGL